MGKVLKKVQEYGHVEEKMGEMMENERVKEENQEMAKDVQKY